METFFLAPQEKGYFVLSDVFHFIDEEQIHHHLAVLLARNNLESKLNAPNAIPELGIHPDLLNSKASSFSYCMFCQTNIGSN